MAAVIKPKGRINNPKRAKKKDAEKKGKNPFIRTSFFKTPKYGTMFLHYDELLF